MIDFNFFLTIALLSCKMGHVLYVGHLSNILSSKAQSQGTFHYFMEWDFYLIFQIPQSVSL